MELEPASTEFQPVDDKRPKMLPPPPVQLVAITDVTLNAAAGLEKQLDAFYAGLLRLERDEQPAASGERIVYRAENVRLHLRIQEVPPPREDFRPLGVVVPSLAELIQRLTDAEVEFVKQRGLFAGSESLMLMDPAGNYVQTFESGAMI